MKKVMIVIMTGITVFVAVSLLMYKCTSTIRDSIENETTKQVETTSKYDLSLTIDEYNFSTFNEVSDYVNYIVGNYVDEKFRYFIDLYKIKKLVEESIYGNIEGKGFVINNSIYLAQKNIFAYIFKSNSDWSDLPITDNFRAKFSTAGSLAKYYSLPEDLIDRGEQNGFSIIITDNIPKDYESIKYEFICIFNDDGYFDNIYYLGRNKEEHIYDVEMIPLEYEMNDIDYIKWCIHDLCVSEEYLMQGGDELTDFDTHIKDLNTYSINYKYRDKVFHSNGILPIKDYLKDSLEVISYDEKTKEAVVKIETEDKKIYYRIRLDIDEYYSLQDATVELDREEDK